MVPGTRLYPSIAAYCPRKSSTEGALLEGGFEVVGDFLGEDVEISNITLEPFIDHFYLFTFFCFARLSRRKGCR